MRWIREHKLIFTVIVVLVILIVLLCISSSVAKKQSATGATAAKGVLGVFSNIGDFVNKNVSGIFSYSKLQAEIEELEAENADLKQQLIEEKLSSEELDELRDLKELLNYTDVLNNYEIVTCDIKIKDETNLIKDFNITAGTDDGIAVGDSVIYGNALVGRVESVSSGTANVCAITSSKVNIGFKVQRDFTVTGICSGDGKGGLTGYLMNTDDEIMVGDVLITSGLGTYEEGLEIGVVKSIIYNSNTYRTEITVEPSADSKSLSKVSVIKK